MENFFSHLPLYACHKRVNAAKITNIHSPEAGVGGNVPTTLVFAGELPSVVVTPEWVAKHQPKIGGYFVAYKDGYESYSPAEAFEEGYTLLNK
ncbi:MAG: hypothetical protein JHC54_15065 [Acinetobacter sp.]|nr:hypothetical protein [Acinetobacter sp.]